MDHIKLSTSNFENIRQSELKTKNKTDFDKSKNNINCKNSTDMTALSSYLDGQVLDNSMLGPLTP